MTLATVTLFANTPSPTEPRVGGTVQIAGPAGLVAGDEIHVIIKGPTTRTTIDAWDSAGSPVTLTFTAIGAAYDDGGAFSCGIRPWKYKLTGSETWPLNLSNTNGGSAVYAAFGVHGQHTTTSTEQLTSYVKALNTNPIVVPSVTATDADSILVCAIATDGNSSITGASTPATTKIEDGSTGPAGYDVTAYRAITSAGATGTTSFSLLAADSAIAYAYLIRPAAAGGGGGGSPEGMMLMLASA